MIYSIYCTHPLNISTYSSDDAMIHSNYRAHPSKRGPYGSTHAASDCRFQAAEPRTRPGCVRDTAAGAFRAGCRREAPPLCRHLERRVDTLKSGNRVAHHRSVHVVHSCFPAVEGHQGEVRRHSLMAGASLEEDRHSVGRYWAWLGGSGDLDRKVLHTDSCSWSCCTCWAEDHRVNHDHAWSSWIRRLRGVPCRKCHRTCHLHLVPRAHEEDDDCRHKNSSSHRLSGVCRSA